MVVLTKIYTRTGDDGTTALGDGTRIRIPSLGVDAPVLPVGVTGDALEVPADIVAQRLAAWTPRPPNYAGGVLAKYAALVSSASEGAVTTGASRGAHALAVIRNNAMTVSLLTCTRTPFRQASAFNPQHRRRPAAWALPLRWKSVRRS